MGDTVQFSVVLVGFGSVGRAFVRLLKQKRALLENDYSLDIQISGIATGRHGMVIDPGGVDIDRALTLVESGGSLQVLSTLPAPATVLDFIQACPGDALLENTPVNHETGAPAVDHLRCALENGMHAITANKGPLAHAYRELRDLAQSRGRRFLFESTVMDGAPIFSLFRETLPAVELHGFLGILNSCTNLILERMEQEDTFEQAVEYARSVGITETDPSADIDGWDAAIKVAALVNILMDIPLKPQQVARQGIRHITPAVVQEVRASGKRWKLICQASIEAGVLQARVAPELVPPESPLYSINGASSYIQFHSDVLPGLGIVETDPGPNTTAYGLLADLLSAARKTR